MPYIWYLPLPVLICMKTYNLASQCDFGSDESFGDFHCALCKAIDGCRCEGLSPRGVPMRHEIVEYFRIEQLDIVCSLEAA